MWTETGTIRKDPGGKLNVALVYPSTYWVGMSNLGFQQMYRLLNAHPGILCERFFSDRERSVETGRPLSAFHIIAFSISYELDYIEAVRILARSGVRVSSTERAGSPLVMAGGAAVTMNPEPFAQACDICFLGDGETLPENLHDAFATSPDLGEFLLRMEQAPGVYLPGRTRPVLEGEAITGFEGPLPRFSRVQNLTDPARTCVFTRDTAFGDMFLVETARGCPFSCAFCSAREIYAPYRSVPLANLSPVLDEAARHRDKVGLVSTSLNNHPQAPAIFAGIRERGLKVAPPSLRAGMIGPELLDAMTASGVKGATLAPETGSDELRFSTGKRMPTGTILEDVRSLVSAGIRDIKLYFMVGLPGETPSHLDATVDLVKRVRQVFIQVSRGNRRIGTVSASINTFVPKPHTPFERHAMIDPGEAKARIRHIARSLSRESNVSVSFEGTKWSYLQALVSRGDRRLFGLMQELSARDASSWHRFLKQWPRNPDYYALRERAEDEVLPWSFLRGACHAEVGHDTEAHG
jgi:radical SAM superfamily enzyme YgiQ (UPF0313 family)